MAREKVKRTLNFKPLVKAFGPLGHKGENSITLFHEEIEAIYLMDLLGLYQADAAISFDEVDGKRRAAVRLHYPSGDQADR